MRYVFEHEEVASCYDCPMFHGFSCSLDPDRVWSDDDLDSLGDQRPEWCALEERRASDEAGA